MQRELSQLFLQKNRLAQLGLAVSKINHDLRNMLSNAQLISDRLTDIPDATVQRFAPKLIASLDRAINFCNDSLKFGRAEEATPRRELMRLRPMLEDVGDGLGLPREGSMEWVVEVEDTLRIDADREHLFRVLSNLVRNAVQALEGRNRASARMPGALRSAPGAKAAAFLWRCATTVPVFRQRRARTCSVPSKEACARAARAWVLPLRQS